MPERDVSVVIDRPIEDVFEYMNDVSREHEWQPHLLEAEQFPPGPASVGTRRRYVSEFLGRKVENTYEVTVWEPRRRIVLQTLPGSTMDARSEVRWEALDGGTRVTMSATGKARGALRLVPRPLLESTFEAELRRALGRLKERLEG